MPRLTQPGLPKEVRAIVEVLGNQATTKLLRLASIRPRTAAELAGELGANHSSVYRKLLALEEAGFIEADRPQGQRVGVSVHWSTNKERVTEASRRWLTFVVAEDDGQPT